jgi:hypothetical protein
MRMTLSPGERSEHWGDRPALGPGEGGVSDSELVNHHSVPPSIGGTAAKGGEGGVSAANS